MITHSDNITKLLGAMLKVQGAVDGVAKTSTNPHFKSRYASLESVVDTIRPHCQEHGLVVMQAPGECREGAIAIETMIAHAASGEWIKSTVTLPLAKNDPQGAGSAITYGERYSLMALFNLPPVNDDDGEAAIRRPEPSQPAPVKIADNAADAKADALIAQISGLRTPEELDELRADPDFLTLYKRLGLSNQARVQHAGKRKAESFAAPIGAG